VPLLVRHPRKLAAGTVCDGFVQHHDIAATALHASGVTPAQEIDGISFYDMAFQGGAPIRDHVTVGWGSAMTVIDDTHWLNCKINGKGPFLYDSPRPAPDARNLADEQPDLVHALFEVGKADARGGFPDYLMQQAEDANDAPGCSPFAAIRARGLAEPHDPVDQEALDKGAR
jgi:hypothetical protein